MNYYAIITRKINAMLFLFVCLQVITWTMTEKYEPSLGILGQVPTVTSAKIAALGDEQVYFRFLALQLQNSGDSFGRFTPLKKYDYKLLKKWMFLLDELDYRSNFVPSIAAYYYSNTQNEQDNIYIVEYLEANYDKLPKEKWWWLGMAVNIAQHKLHDQKLALRLAEKLAVTPNAHMARWAQQMPAFIAANMGEREMALRMIKEIADKYDDYTQGELNFMNNFIKERLGYVKEYVDKRAKVHDVEPLYPNQKSSLENDVYTVFKKKYEAEKKMKEKEEKK